MYAVDPNANDIIFIDVIKQYSAHIIRECENCGQLIEISEIKSNPHTIYCKHCRMTQFDGPDLYD